MGLERPPFLKLMSITFCTYARTDPYDYAPVYWFSPLAAYPSTIPLLITLLRLSMSGV
jgi:hypothetical protein